MMVRKLLLLGGILGAYALSVLVLEPSHWIMQMRQFENLKRRAEHDNVPTNEHVLIA